MRDHRPRPGRPARHRGDPRRAPAQARPAPGVEWVITAPGQDAQPGIEETPAEPRLRPAAVLLTHGHVDHIWSVAPVCGAKGIPAYIHPDDRALLSDPAKGLPLGAGQELFGGLEFTEPDDVKELADGMTLSLVGLEIVVNHAPGHTEGSVAFRMPLDPPNSAQGQSKTGPAETPGATPGVAEAPRAPASDPGGIL